MRLTVKEMELLCVLHAGTRSATLGALREAAKQGGDHQQRIGDIESLIEKLSGMKDGDSVFLDFEPEK